MCAGRPSGRDVLQRRYDIPVEMPVLVGSVVHPDGAVVLLPGWSRTQNIGEKGPLSEVPFLMAATDTGKHKFLYCGMLSAPIGRVRATPPVSGPLHKEQRCTVGRMSPQCRGSSVTETRWAKPTFGSSLGRLPAIQTDGDTSVPGDSPLSRHGNSAMLRRLRVVRSTLQTEPLTSAPAALEWSVGGTRRLPAPSIIQGSNAIHERRW